MLQQHAERLWQLFPKEIRKEIPGETLWQPPNWLSHFTAAPKILHPKDGDPAATFFRGPRRLSTVRTQIAQLAELAKTNGAPLQLARSKCQLPRAKPRIPSQEPRPAVSHRVEQLPQWAIITRTGYRSRYRVHRLGGSMSRKTNYSDQKLQGSIYFLELSPKTPFKYHHMYFKSCKCLTACYQYPNASHYLKVIEAYLYSKGRTSVCPYNIHVSNDGSFKAPPTSPFFFFFLVTGEAWVNDLAKSFCLVIAFVITTAHTHALSSVGHFFFCHSYFGSAFFPSTW